MGIGATRPGVSALTATKLVDVGGINTNISNSGRVFVDPTSARQNLVNDSSNLLRSGAGELTGIRNLVSPGFSAFREAGLSSIRNRARSSIGNLRENLARRRVSGSSFAEDAVIRAEAEFAQEEAEFASAATLQELDVFTQLTQQITNQQVAAVERQIQELNLQLDVGLQLAGAATQSLTAASIQQQQNAAGFAQSALDIGAAAAGFCAISREVYGSDPRWLLFRRWLVKESPVWLFRWYLKNQYKAAEWLGNKPLAKRAVRFLMNRIVDG